MAFTRPYYIEGIALLTKPGSPMQEFAALEGGGANTKVSILQNVDAEQSVHTVLPQAQVLQIDTQANVIQALEAGRVDAAAVDLSTVGVDGQAAARQVRRQRQALVQHALQRGRCGRAIPTG